MTMTDIRRITVVGAGAMGSQISMVCALRGFETRVFDPDQDAVDKSMTALRERMERDVSKGRRTPEDVDLAFSRLSLTTDMNVALETADIVIEAAVENLDLKHELFAQFERLAPAHAVLASNTSGFVPSKIAQSVTDPGRVIVMHFFNPALVMKCVEVVCGPETRDGVRDQTVALAEALGKTPVVLTKEIPGFVANRILNAVRDEAIFLLENGITDVESIDSACRIALGYPMGPFELMDLTGIDIGYRTKTARFEETGNPADAPSTSMTRLVQEGHLGRKTGRGWYQYDHDGNRIKGATWTSH